MSQITRDPLVLDDEEAHVVELGGYVLLATYTGTTAGGKPDLTDFYAHPLLYGSSIIMIQESAGKRDRGVLSLAEALTLSTLAVERAVEQRRDGS